MATYKKATFLFLALLFPVLIFLFLKFFGKNEFTVPRLFEDAYPENMSECGSVVALPYRIADSVQTSLSLSKERLTLFYFDRGDSSVEKNLERIKQESENNIEFKVLPDSLSKMKTCVFFLHESNDLVLLDNRGAIRGQYASGDRDEIDRLRMELSILLKEY